MRRLTAAAGALPTYSQGDQLCSLMLARERLALRLTASLPSMTVERDVLQQALDFMRTDSDTESDPGACTTEYHRGCFSTLGVSAPLAKVVWTRRDTQCSAHSTAWSSTSRALY